MQGASRARHLRTGDGADGAAAAGLAPAGATVRPPAPSPRQPPLQQSSSSNRAWAGGRVARTLLFFSPLSCFCRRYELLGERAVQTQLVIIYFRQEGDEPPARASYPCEGRRSTAGVQGGWASGC